MRGLCTRILGVLLLGGAPAVTPASFAQGADDAGEASTQPRVMLGHCELRLDPAQPAGEAALTWSTCIKASLGVEVTSVSGTPDENSWMKYGHLYGGLFLSDWLALQARGWARQTESLGDKVEGERDIDTDYAVVQVGNPALHHWRLTTGRLRLPFGIDRTAATEHYQSFDNREFWNSPRYGAYATYDNKRSFIVEVGTATDKLGKRQDDDEVAPEPGAPEVGSPEAKDEADETLQASSLRLMADFAALDGSRVVLSGYGESHGVRRMGAGFLAVSAREDLTAFELIRRLRTAEGRDGPFEQLLRIGYVGTWRNDTRWVVQFDDERLRSRRGTLGHDALIYGHFLLRLAVAYHKSETGDGARRWYVTSGVEARL